MSNPDSDSEEEHKIVRFLDSSKSLFKQKDNYVKKGSIYYLDGNIENFHPFLYQIVRKNQSKTLEA